MGRLSERETWCRLNIDPAKVKKFLEQKIQESSLEAVSEFVPYKAIELQALAEGKKYPVGSVTRALLQAYQLPLDYFSIFSFTLVTQLLFVYAIREGGGHLPKKVNLPNSLYALSSCYAYFRLIRAANLILSSYNDRNHLPERSIFKREDFKWSDQELLGFIREKARTLGRAPRCDELDLVVEGKQHHFGQTIVKRFSSKRVFYPGTKTAVIGGWNKAIIRAGLVPNKKVTKR